MSLTEGARSVLNDKDDSDVVAFMQERPHHDGCSRLTLGEQVCERSPGPLISSEMASRLPRSNPVASCSRIRKLAQVDRGQSLDHGLRSNAPTVTRGSPQSSTTSPSLPSSTFSPLGAQQPCTLNAAHATTIGAAPDVPPLRVHIPPPIIAPPPLGTPADSTPIQIHRLRPLPRLPLCIHPPCPIAEEGLEEEVAVGGGVRE